MSEHRTNVTHKFYTDGHTEEGSWKMTLTELQQFVGGYIEQVPSNQPHRALIVNEEGLLDNLPTNSPASIFVAPGTLVIGGLIRGNALLIKV